MANIEEVGSRYIQPIDYLVANVAPRHAAGFVATCVEVAKFVEAAQPDIAVFPVRGAAPIMHTIHGAGGMSEIECVEPPLGSAIANMGNQGVDKPTKQKILAEYVQPGMLVAVIDESQNGGTMRQHGNFVKKITGEPVIACQVQDERVQPRYRVGNSSLLSHSSRQFTGPIFHIDRNIFLDEIVDTDDTRVVIVNTDARGIFQVLGSGSQQPITVEELVSDQVPQVPLDQISSWVADFNAQGLSI